MDSKSYHLEGEEASNQSREPRPRVGRRLKATGDYIREVQINNIYREDSGSDAPHIAPSNLSSNFKMEGDKQFSVHSLNYTINEPKSALPLHSK